MLKDKYIEYITFEKRFSPHTIVAYTSDLNEFSDYLNFQYTCNSPEAADYLMIRSWLVYLFENHLTARSINRKLSALKSFYRFCTIQGAIGMNPMVKVVAPRNVDKLPLFLSKENIHKLFDVVDFGTGYEAARDRAILLLFYATGIRRAELTNLNLLNVDFEKGTIKVMGKRSKERIIPLGPSVVKELKSYLIIRDTFLTDKKNNTNAFFVTSKGKSPYPEFIYGIVHKYLKLIASNQKLSPHILRHTFATHMLDDGADLNAIKELLGHSSLAATQVYTHNTIEKLKTIYKQAHPRA